MESELDSNAEAPIESNALPSDLSIVIEDLRQFASDDDAIQDGFESAVKDFGNSSDQIREIRANKDVVIEKFHQQYSDHVAASELLDENGKLFDEICQLLPSRSESPSSVEERESFDSERLLLEEAIKKYRNEIPDLESQHTMELENMKRNHDMEQSRLRERKRTLESQIKASMEDFERQKMELKLKHDRVLETLSKKFKTRLSEIEELESHKQCESELTTLRSSWNEKLQGLALAIERTREEISGKRSKKRRTSSNIEVTEENQADPLLPDFVRLEGNNFPFLRECKVVIERLEEIPGSSNYSNRSEYRDEVSPDASVDTDRLALSSPSTSSEPSALKKRLFSEEQVQGTLGNITETTPSTIEGYLKSLQRIVSENTKEQKRLARRKTP